MKKILLAAFALLFTVGMAQAQPQQRPHKKSIRTIQKVHQKRIAHGMRNGSLTPREVTRLERQQMRIQHEKRMARADGRFNNKERARIRNQQRIASREIYIKKHNRQNWK